MLGAASLSGAGVMGRSTTRGLVGSSRNGLTTHNLKTPLPERAESFACVAVASGDHLPLGASSLILKPVDTRKMPPSSRTSPSTPSAKAIRLKTGMSPVAGTAVVGATLGEGVRDSSNAERSKTGMGPAGGAVTASASYGEGSVAHTRA